MLNHLDSTWDIILLQNMDNSRHETVICVSPRKVCRFADICHHHTKGPTGTASNHGSPLDFWGYSAFRAISQRFAPDTCQRLLTKKLLASTGILIFRKTHLFASSNYIDLALSK